MSNSTRDFLDYIDKMPKALQPEARSLLQDKEVLEAACAADPQWPFEVVILQAKMFAAYAATPEFRDMGNAEAEANTFLAFMQNMDDAFKHAQIRFFNDQNRLA